MKTEQLKLAMTILTKYFIKVIFNVIAFLFPINQSKITFASYRADKLKGNLLYIYQEFEGQNLDFNYVFLFKHYQSSLFGKFDYFFHMVRASYHLATSRYFIIDDYYFPVYCISPRKGTDIVQLWHAAGAFKTFGYSTVGKSFGPNSEYLKHIKIHSNYTKAFVSSSEVIPYYAEAFNMKETNIFPLGVPRTDYFFNEIKHRHIQDHFYKIYPELQGKTLILYAPTFRGKSHYQETFYLPFDAKQLHEELGDQFALLIHLHPYMNGTLHLDQQLMDFAYHIYSEFDIDTLMTLSDLLITDYSSVIFDYSLLEKPMAFYASDLDAYIQERGFYYPYLDFIPGPFFDNTIELSSWIKMGNYNLEIVRAFKERFFNEPNGQASERIVQCLLNGIKSS